MNIIKRLVAGKYPLSTIFFGFGFVGNWLIGIIFKTLPIKFLTSADNNTIIYFLLTGYVLKIILSAAVLSGLIYILKPKFNILCLLAIIVVIINILVNGYLFVNFFSALH